MTIEGARVQNRGKVGSASEKGSSRGATGDDERRRSVARVADVVRRPGEEQKQMDLRASHRKVEAEIR